MHKIETWRRSVALLIIAAAATGFAADFLFWGGALGWNIPLFAGVLCAVILLRPGEALSARRGRVLLGLTAGLLLALVWDRSVLGTLLLAAGVFALAVLHRGGWTADPVEWGARVGRFLEAWPTRLLKDGRLLFRRSRSRKGPSRAFRFIKSWVLPVALGSVFVGLFAMANPVISGWLDALDSRFMRIFGRFGDLLHPARIILFVLVSAGTWALLRFRVRGQGGWQDVVNRVQTTLPPPEPVGAYARVTPQMIVDTPGGGAYRTPPPKPVPQTVRITPELLVRCLLVFNGVFAVQTLLDIYFLFFGASLPHGMTYAAYAHRGAYPLIATAALAATFVLATFRPGASGPQWRLAHRLVFIWIAQNIFLTFTAVWRLALYVEVYSLTRLRVAAAVWMVMVAAGLVWIVVRIVQRQSNAWLVRVNLGTALGVLYLCSLAPIDSSIAWFNVRHCDEVGGEGTAIDLSYLSQLDVDALPALRWLEAELRETSETRDAMSMMADKVGARADWIVGNARTRMRDWRGWTIRDVLRVRADDEVRSHAGRHSSEPYALLFTDVSCFAVDAELTSASMDHLGPKGFPVTVTARDGVDGMVRVRSDVYFDADYDENILAHVPAGASFRADGPYKDPSFGLYYIVAARDSEGEECLGYVSASVVD